MALNPALIRSARESAGLTPTELAAAVGRSEQSVKLYERGVIVPPTNIVVAMAEVLGVHEGDFYDAAASAHA